jgi:alpha-ketoglutarate-dependent taurine dioxygenase
MTPTPTPTVRHTPLGTGDGVLLTPVDPAVRGPAALFDAELDSLLATAGHLVLRGFDLTVEDFNALVGHYSSRTTLDPARSFHGDVAQKVDSGHDPIGLHIENGATPFAPELLWFHCVKAAKSGSQTTVCDGYRVWEGLSETAREVFTAQPISYARSVPARLWQRLAAVMAGDGRAPEDCTVEDLYALANEGADVDFKQDPDGTLHYRYRVFAAHPTKWSDRIAWANSLLGPSYNYEAPVIEFADGTPLAEEIVAEYVEVTAALTEDIAWVDGDTVLIDNSRVMHGRRAITDPDRTILNAQSYARRPARSAGATEQKENHGAGH